jgi:hypothetical protein
MAAAALTYRPPQPRTTRHDGHGVGYHDRTVRWERPVVRQFWINDQATTQRRSRQLLMTR